MTPAENDSAACPLLDNFPAELRNRIYEFAFSSDFEDRITKWTGPSADEMEPAALATQHLPPPLLQTCRQIRSEAMGMWKANVSCFVYTDALNLGRFARLIGFENFLKIHKLVDRKMWTTQREAENAIVLARQHLFGMGIVFKKGVFEASWQSMAALRIQGTVWIMKRKAFMVEMGE